MSAPATLERPGAWVNASEEHLPMVKSKRFPLEDKPAKPHAPARR